MTAESLEHLAAEIGAVDLFVFHVLSDERMVNLDGWGRGSGWAGNVCLDPETERFLASAMDTGIARMGPGSPTRVFGPYWAEEAVAVRKNGHVVAMGGPGIADLPEERIAETADKAVSAVEEVRTTRRLADKLEISQAELSVATIEAGSLHEAAEHLAHAAARALSCEFGAVLLLADPMTVTIADEGWRPAATTEEIATALIPLIGAVGEELMVEQDLRESPYAVPPISFKDGLVSRCSAPFDVDGRRGLIVVAHSGSAPRGFTDLCRRVAAKMASTATIPLSRHT